MAWPPALPMDTFAAWAIQVLVVTHMVDRQSIGNVSNEYPVGQPMSVLSFHGPPLPLSHRIARSLGSLGVDPAALVSNDRAGPEPFPDVLGRPFHERSRHGGTLPYNLDELHDDGDATRREEVEVGGGIGGVEVDEGRIADAELGPDVAAVGLESPGDRAPGRGDQQHSLGNGDGGDRNRGGGVDHPGLGVLVTGARDGERADALHPATGQAGLDAGDVEGSKSVGHICRLARETPPESGSQGGSRKDADRCSRSITHQYGGKQEKLQDGLTNRLRRF